MIKEQLIALISQSDKPAVDLHLPNDLFQHCKPCDSRVSGKINGLYPFEKLNSFYLIREHTGINKLFYLLKVLTDTC